jgi:glyoxylase-like metal-dependent hydrolase (beta-lactamase superfamily II)
MLRVCKIPVEPLDSNCYLVWDGDSLEAAVIDPGGEGDRIIQEAKKRSLNVRFILNTHGHGDHIAANAEIRETFGAPILISEAEAALLSDPLLNLSAAYGMPVTSPAPDGFLVPGGKVMVGGVEFGVLDTAGHSPGGVSFYSDCAVITGDALFMGSIGRCDLPGGDEELLITNIRKNLLTLPDRTIVYPGHGPNTTIGAERSSNPYLI